MVRWIAALAALGLILARTAALAAPPVEAYGKLPAVEQIGLSPTGGRYVFISVIGETRKLVAVTADGLTPLYAIDVGAAKVVDVSWAGEDHLLVTIFSTEALGGGFNVAKGEFANVVAINLKTRSAFSVFAGHPEVANLVHGRFGVANVAGHWYGYFGGVTYEGGPGEDPVLTHMWADLYRVDLDSGAIHRLEKGDGDVFDWLVGPDGTIVARTMYSDAQRAWQVRAGAINGRVLASGQSDIRPLGRLSLGRSADHILFERPTADGSVYEEVALAQGDAAEPPADEKVEDVLGDPVSHLWIGEMDRGDQLTPHFFAPVAEARIRGAYKAFPGLTVQLKSFTPDLGRLIVETSGTGDSGTFWLVDIARGSADPVGYAYPAVKSADVGEIRMVDWKAADGLELHGVLNLPPGRDAKALPVIVMPHGGPEERDFPVFGWWSQLFASRGYAVFQPNFRGSSGYGDAFRNAGFGQWGRKMQTDVSDGLAALVKDGLVDPKRACIVGWSYGGYAAQAGVTVQHGLYRCAVSMAGLSDLGAFLNYASDYHGSMTIEQRYWRSFMGVNGDWNSVLNPISPAKHAAEADAPLLLIHGKDDTVVPIAQSLEMEQALKAAGKPVELVTLPGADHWLLHEDTRLAMARASLDFVLKNNPPDPEPPAAAPTPRAH
jgi:pimeloyl-ACP methyl ester carboxylesterase